MIHDDDIKEITRSQIITTLLKNLASNNKELSPHLVTDQLWPKHSRYSSVMLGLKTSLGFFWENIANEFASRNDFDVSLKHQKPVPEHPELDKLVSKWVKCRKDQNAAGKPVSLDEYRKQLDAMFSKDAPIKDTDCKDFASGDGSDLHWEKNGKYYIFDTKTVQINSGSGNKFDATAIEWIGRLKHKYGNTIAAKDIEVRYVFPYNSHNWKNDEGWFDHFADRAKPMTKEEIYVGNQFWGWLTGNDKALELIFDAIGEINEDPSLMEILNDCIKRIACSKDSHGLKIAEFENRISRIEYLRNVEYIGLKPINGLGVDYDGNKIGTKSDGSGSGKYGKWKHGNCEFYASRSEMEKFDEDIICRKCGELLFVL